MQKLLTEEMKFSEVNFHVSPAIGTFKQLTAHYDHQISKYILIFQKLNHSCFRSCGKKNKLITTASKSIGGDESVIFVIFT